MKEVYVDAAKKKSAMSLIALTRDTIKDWDFMHKGMFFVLFHEAFKDELREGIETLQDKRKEELDIDENLN